MIDAIPNAAAQVAHRLGIPRPGAFDINTACAGLLLRLAAADHAVRTGTVRHVLVVGAEKLSDWTNWTTGRPRSSSPTAPAPRSSAPRRANPGIGPVVWGCDEDQSRPSGSRAGTGHFIQEGQAVFRWATTRDRPGGDPGAAAAGAELADVDVLVPPSGQPAHRRRHRQEDRAGRPGRPQGRRGHRHSGNTSSASIPIALDRMRAAGEPRSGEVVLSRVRRRADLRGQVSSAPEHRP